METLEYSVFSFLIISLIAVPVFCDALTGDIELISPANETWTNMSNVDLVFTFNYTDPYNATANCSLYINGTLSEYVTAGNASTSGFYSLIAFSNGENTWSVTCENGTTIYSEVRTFYLDSEAPQVSLISPNDGSNIQPGSTSFSFLYRDSSSVTASCSLFLDNVWRATNPSVQNNSGTSLVTDLTDGYYNWRVDCSDFAGNLGSSIENSLIVGEPLSVEITSPTEQTYGYMDDIPLQFNVIGSYVWLGYSLDGYPNVTVTGNTTFDIGNEGTHLIIVYANNSNDDVVSDSVQFTVTSGQHVNIIEPVDDEEFSTDSVDVEVVTDIEVKLCVISLDDENPVAMSNTSSTEWSAELTDLEDGDHDISVDCVHSGSTWITNTTSFSVDLGVIHEPRQFVIDVTSPDEVTYWSIDAVDIHVETPLDVTFCRLFLNSEGPVTMDSYDPLTWYYNLTIVDDGLQRLSVECNDSSGGYSSRDITFTVKGYDCDSDDAGICTEVQECVNFSCIDLVCEGCAYAENRTCKPYECCTDDECLSGQSCVDNECIDVECECGKIVEHVCQKYECCSNFDCGTGEECNLSSHTCSVKSMAILAPDSVTSGQTFTVKVVDQGGDPIPNAVVKVSYTSGSKDELLTNSEGTVFVLAKESGTILVIAEKSGFDTVTFATDVAAGFNWGIVVILITLIAIGGGAYFYWLQLPPVLLKKVKKGQNVTLKILNRTGEYIENVIILDSIPSRSLISSEVNARVENFGTEDRLTWFAALNPREEIVINYQAHETSNTFNARIADDEFESGYGITLIVMEVINNILKNFQKKGEKVEKTEEI